MNIRRAAGFIHKAMERTQERQSWRRVCVTSQGEKQPHGDKFINTLRPLSNLFYCMLHFVCLPNSSSAVSYH